MGCSDFDPPCQVRYFSGPHQKSQRHRQRSTRRSRAGEIGSVLGPLRVVGRERFAYGALVTSRQRLGTYRGEW
jgi:hypothetical protein